MPLIALSFGARSDTSTGEPTDVKGRSVVYYGDLNLNAEQDAKIMLQRIERAAKTACGGHAANFAMARKWKFPAGKPDCSRPR